MENELKGKMAREEVIIITDRDFIQGTLCRHHDVRFSDALGAPAYHNLPYLALANATVSRLETGQEILCSRFLLVSRDQITALAPRSEIHSIEFFNRNPPPTELSELKGSWINVDELLERISPLIKSGMDD